MQMRCVISITDSFCVNTCTKKIFAWREITFSLMRSCLCRWLAIFWTKR